MLHEYRCYRWSPFLLILPYCVTVEEKEMLIAWVQMLSLKSKSFNAIICDFQTVEEKEVETPSQPLDLGFPDDDDDANSPEGCTYTGFFFLSISVDVFFTSLLISLCVSISLCLKNFTSTDTSLSLHLLCVETYLSHIIISESNPHQRPLAVFKQLFIYMFMIFALNLKTSMTHQRYLNSL